MQSNTITKTESQQINSVQAPNQPTDRFLSHVQLQNGEKTKLCGVSRLVPGACLGQHDLSVGELLSVSMSKGKAEALCVHENRQCTTA